MISFVNDFVTVQRGKTMAEGKHITLANNLEQNILSGKYGQEGGLPSASELAQEWHISVNTVKNALAVLEGKGLIAKRGIGYYVNKIDINMSNLGPAHSKQPDSFKRNIGPVKQTTLPAHLAQSAQLDASTVAVYKMQVSGNTENNQEKPIQLAHKYYTLAISDDELKKMNKDSTYDPVANLGGELLSRDELSSRLATDSEKDLLELEGGDVPVLSVLETIRDKQDRVLLIQEVTVVSSTLIFNYPFNNK